SRNKVKDAKSGLFLDFREEGAAGEETDRKALRRRAHAVRLAKQRRPRRSAAIGKLWKEENIATKFSLIDFRCNRM
ncbi:MAG: hypothetical protein EA357_00520, partial [Micavibrio sp.]